MTPEAFKKQLTELRLRYAKALEDGQDGYAEELRLELESMEDINDSVEWGDEALLECTRPNKIREASQSPRLSESPDLP